MSKSTKRIRVAAGEQLLPVGELIFETDGRRETSMFRYDADWLENPQHFAIAPAMPLSETPFYHSGTRESPRSALPGPISDGAPDSWGRGLIRKTLRYAPTELDYLLTVDDATRQGALRYLGEDGRPLSQSCPPVPRLNAIEDLRQLAKAAESNPDMPREERERLMGSAGSLGGARPKSNIRDDDGNLSIAKFTSDRDTMPIERAEVATLRLARAAGINAATARLELGNTDRPVALLKRFDRMGSGRVSYISGQSFIGAETATSAYYTDFSDALRAHSADPKGQMEELYRRILFTILVSNNDDHLKNHGLLYSGQDLWILSPAFDINPQPQRRRHLETGISEFSGNEASIEAALEAAPFFETGRDAAAAMLSRMVSTIDAQWQTHCREAGMSGKEIAAYEPAFNHQETHFARRHAGKHKKSI